MKYKDIMDALMALSTATNTLEREYFENGGEMTDRTESLEEQKEALSALLEGEGIDSLGRWLKVKEDEKAMIKAEKALADRKIKTIDNTIDYIKSVIGEVLRATGREKVAGTFYSFSQFTSVKTSCDMEAIEQKWYDALDKAAEELHLPGYLDLSLKTTATRIKEWAQDHDGAGSEFLTTESVETCKYTKPRTPKE